jgi:undecaprenyl phosphate N,N'-diacetylbacillosamine 1-phosphate transferase
MYAKYIKRPMDFVLSLIALVVLSPILFILTIVGAIVMRGNPFFVQPRPGKNEKIFKLIKFRTMTCEKDENGNLFPDEKRLTKYGKFLRSTSLDELPELINIIKGDMTIVGPRPLLVEYLPYYTDEEAHRHDVRPGLTGWAQVNGRNITVWDERLQQDLYYVKNCSFLLDAKILFMTVMKVVKKSDIIVGNQYGEGHGKLDKVRHYIPQREFLMDGTPVTDRK